jgi:ribonuclease Z
VTISELLEKTRTNYDGPLVAGEDLMSFEVGDEVIVSETTHP